MSHLSKLLLLSCLACAAACTVPTIDEVEKEEGPAGCNDTDHKCPQGFVCFDNRCISTQGLSCIPGTIEDCNSSGLGECLAGTHVCGADGTFGACESKKKPAREVCDGLDNDCDGKPDYWSAPFALSKTLDSGSTLAAIPVRRTPDGTQDTLLVLEPEARNLVVRTLAPDGSMKQGTTFPPTGTSYGFLFPSLAADGDTVAAAWLEQGTAPSGAPDSRVKLSLLDGSGNRTASQVLEFSYGSSSVSRVKVAINSTHVLVAVTSALSSTSTAVTAVHTVPRGTFTQAAALGPNKINTAHRGGFGLDVTANGDGSAFLVVLEDAGIRKTLIVKNDGTLVNTAGATITQDSLTHSPFIAPVKGDSVRHIVYYVENSATGSQLLAVGCSDQLCSSQPTPLGSMDQNVESMVMARRPGMQGLESVLWVWTDSSKTKVLGVGTLTSSGVKEWTPLRPPGDATLSEALVVMPDSTRYLAYTQYAPALAVSYVTEAYLMPFCGP